LLIIDAVSCVFISSAASQSDVAITGKCIASQSRSTFFSISASSLTSKWVCYRIISYSVVIAHEFFITGYNHMYIATFHFLISFNYFIFYYFLIIFLL